MEIKVQLSKTLKAIIADIIKSEGGYVNHKSDKGGETNMGITDISYKEYCKRQGSYAKSVEHLTEEDALNFYIDRFYRSNINLLAEELWHLMFDMQVMSGRWAARVLQRTMRDHFGCKNLVLDGYIGKVTADSVNNAVKMYGAEKVIDIVTIGRLHFYKDIVYLNNSQEVFLRGWNNRACKFFTFGV